VWYESSASKRIFLVLVLLALLTGALTLRVAWQKTPKAEEDHSASEDLQNLLQEPGPIRESGRIQ
jgi:hypothetical protein